MTNKQLRAEVFPARPTLEPLEIAKIERTLRNLPQRKKRTMLEKMSVALPIAAAIVLVVTLAAPPVVRAVSDFIDRVFAQKAREIEEYQAMPEDEKVRELTAIMDAQGFYHTYEDHGTDYRGVTIYVEEASVSWDRDTDQGTISVSLCYSEPPAFDPNWMDFTIVMGGVEYPEKKYAGLNAEKRVTNAEQWKDEGHSWDSNTTFYLGTDKLFTSIHFPIENLKIDGKTDLLVSGEMDGEKFEIPFEIDPEAGLAANRELAYEYINSEGTREYLEESGKKLAEFAAAAVPVGVEAKVLNDRFIIPEMAVTGDNRFHFALSVPDTKLTSAGEAVHTYNIFDAYVDGHELDFEGIDNESIDDGVFTCIYSYELGVPLNTLSDESIIWVNLYMPDFSYETEGWGEGPIVVEDIAYKYNPKTNAVTLPRNDAEMQEWVEIATKSAP